MGANTGHGTEWRMLRFSSCGGAGCVETDLFESVLLSREPASTLGQWIVNITMCLNHQEGLL